jgi:excisionase family DNA binding protein
MLASAVLSQNEYGPSFFRAVFCRNVAPRQPAYFSRGAERVQLTNPIETVGCPQVLEDFRNIIRYEMSQAQAAAPLVPATEEELLTIRQAATLLDVCVATIHQWKRMGLLAHTRLGGRVYLKKTEVLNAGTRCRRSGK